MKASQCALFLIPLIYYFLTGDLLAQDQIIGFDSTELTNSRDTFFSYIEGSVGTYVVVCAGMGAIISSSMGMYGASKTMLVASAGTFIIKSVTLTFFPDKVDDLSTISTPPVISTSGETDSFKAPDPEPEPIPTAIAPQISSPAPTAIPAKPTPKSKPTVKQEQPTPKPTSKPTTAVPTVATPKKTKKPDPTPTPKPKEKCEIYETDKRVDPPTRTKLKCIVVKLKSGGNNGGIGSGSGGGSSICHYDNGRSSCDKEPLVCACVKPGAQNSIPDGYELVDDQGNM